MRKVFIGASILALIVGATKGRDIIAKLRAAESLTFDVTAFRFKSMASNFLNFDLIAEVTNHTDTALKVQDLLLNVNLPSGFPAAKISQNLNKVLQPRQRTELKLAIKVDALKTGATFAMNALKKFSTGEKLFSGPVKIKGSLKAEDTIVPIEETIGVEENQLNGLTQSPDWVNQIWGA